MFLPSECVLERRVRSDGDLDLSDKNLQLLMLKCEDRKADGYEGKEVEIHNERVKKMNIGVRLAAAPPPAASYLVILGARLFAKIVAVDETVVVIMLGFTGDGGRMSYLVYDAVALSLRMIPPPDRGSNLSIARGASSSCALVVHTTGVLAGTKYGASLRLWQPSSSSRPWSKFKKYSLTGRIDWSAIRIDTEFSFKGHAYWVDLLCGVSYCSCDAVLDDDDNSNPVEFGFIPLPSEARGNHRNYKRVALPVAYRAMGAAGDSLIRFVSINGFQEHVEHKDRTVTVWKLLGHGGKQVQGWEKKHELSLETLWGYQGFGDVPKDLTPMYPLLSTKDADVVYLALGEFYENLYKKKFYPRTARYLLAVDMRNKTVASVPLARSMFDAFVSCGFSRRLRKALVGPCDDEGIPLRGNGGNVVAEAPVPMKKKKLRRREGNVVEQA
uniref:Uncharacterized protein n=1 Tax=Avena sativa TaxID=4498 RepID=A0ACD6ACW5_AVESA